MTVVPRVPQRSSAPARPLGLWGHPGRVTLDDRRLFVVAPDGLAVSAMWSHSRGWSVSITWHTVGHDGPSSETTRYEHLATGELADVVCADLHSRLGLI